jgi:hypothetical protein
MLIPLVKESTPQPLKVVDTTLKTFAQMLLEVKETTSATQSSVKAS